MICGVFTIVPYKVDKGTTDLLYMICTVTKYFVSDASKVKFFGAKYNPNNKKES